MLILLGDGRYLDGDNGKVQGVGKWSRSGATLSLTSEGTAGGGTFEIVSVSARSLTVRAGDEMRVYARP